MTEDIEISLDVRHAMILVFVLGIGTGFLGGTAVSGQITGKAVVQPTGNSDDNPSPTTQRNNQNTGSNGVGKSEISISEEPVLGDEDAEVTVVEFSDYQCPFCRRFYTDTFGQLKEDYIDTGKVKFVYKDFPLEQLGHDNAVQMAEAAECAQDQDKYWEMHDKMFEEQNEISPRRTAKFDSSKITQWADEIGLNMEQYNQCMDSGKYSEEVQQDLSEGQGLGVSGTPTFFVYSENSENAQKLVGAQPYSRFESVISQVQNSDSGTETTGGNKQVDKTIQVSGTEWGFSPSAIQVKKGQTVRVEFKNTGSIPHNLKIPSQGVGSRVIQAGQTDSFTFTAPKSGTSPVSFECSLPGHAANGMKGQIELS